MPSFVQASAANTIVTVPETVDPNTEATVTVVVRDGSSNGIEGIGPAGVVLAVSGTGNTLTQPTGQTTDAGESPGLAFESSVSEAKTITVTVGGLQATTQPSCTVGTTSDVFTMDYSLAAAEAAGFAAEPGEQPFVSIARVVGAGPSGQNIYRLTWAPTETAEAGFGWYENLGTAVLGNPNATVYVRWRWRLGAGSNGRFLSAEGGAQESRLKFFVVNDGYGSGLTGRPITQFNVRYNGGSPQYRWSQVKGGGDDPINTGDEDYVSVDTDWHTVQLLLHYSSDVDEADGRYALWLDNAVEGSPDADSGATIILNYTDGSGAADQVKLGYYQNNAMASDGVQVLEIADFAISTTFTAGWGA